MHLLYVEALLGEGWWEGVVWLGGYVCPLFEYQNLLFRVLRRPCHYQYFAIVFAPFSVFIAVSAHLCVICCHFCCPMSLLRPCRLSEFTLTWPLCCVLQVKFSTTLLHMEEWKRKRQEQSSDRWLSCFFFFFDPIRLCSGKLTCIIIVHSKYSSGFDWLKSHG